MSKKLSKKKCVAGSQVKSSCSHRQKHIQCHIYSFQTVDLNIISQGQSLYRPRTIVQTIALLTKSNRCQHIHLKPLMINSTIFHLSSLQNSKCFTRNKSSFNTKDRTNQNKITYKTKTDGQN